MSKSAESEEDEKPKKAKRTGPSLLQLEREKYLKAGAASSAASKVSRGKRKAGDDDEDVLNALDGFRKKLDQASKKAAPEPKADEEEKREKLHGIDLNDDELEDDDVSSVARLTNRTVQLICLPYSLDRSLGCCIGTLAQVP